MVVLSLFQIRGVVLVAVGRHAVSVFREQDEPPDAVPDEEGQIEQFPVKSHLFRVISKYYDNDLVITHKLSPSQMAKASHELYSSGDTAMNGTYNGYTGPQLLYLTSSYLNGNGLESPGKYAGPSNPEQYSVFAKNSYSINDYISMAGIVKEYMDDNGKAPDSIEYEGAKISYYDLLYNFAKITANHTDGTHMDFAKNYHFEKVHESILITILPYVLVIVVLMLACVGLRKIRGRGRRKRRR